MLLLSTKCHWPQQRFQLPYKLSSCKPMSCQSSYQLCIIYGLTLACSSSEVDSECSSKSQRNPRGGQTKSSTWTVLEGVWRTSPAWDERSMEGSEEWLYVHCTSCKPSFTGWQGQRLSVLYLWRRWSRHHHSDRAMSERGRVRCMHHDEPARLKNADRAWNEA